MNDLIMTEKEFDGVVSHLGGFCTICNLWTDEGIDLHELGAVCPQCGKKAVLGALTSLEMGFVSVKG